jgi:hypothetical protein
VIFSLLLFVLHLLIVNFLLIVSTCGCRLVEPNQINLSTLCDWVIFFLFFFCFFGILKLFCHTIIKKITSNKAKKIPHKLHSNKFSMKGSAKDKFYES